MILERSLKPYPPANIQIVDTSDVPDESSSSSSSGGLAPYAPVTWTDLVNVSDVSNTLTKTGGSGGSWDAGAFSNEGASGDFSVKFVIPATVHNVMIGVSKVNTDASFNTIDYAMAVFVGNQFHKYVEGSGSPLSAIVTGDVLELVKTGTNIIWKLNGVQVGGGESSVPAGTYKVDVSISSASGVIAGVEMEGIDGGGESSSSSSSDAEPIGQVAVTWKNRNRLTSGIKKQSATGDTLEVGQSHTIRIYGEDGVTLLRTVTGETDESYDYTAAFELADTGLLVLQTSLTIKIKSVRDAYESAEVVKVVTRA